jgi:signal transduction histidine kinase
MAMMFTVLAMTRRIHPFGRGCHFRILSLYCCVLGFSSVTVSIVTAQEQRAVLTNASAILALPAARAIQDIKIHIQGVVTAAEKHWDGRFFVQDSTAGVFVDNVSTEQPQPGDLVDVTGVSNPGAFAPVVSKPTWKKIGTAPLPRAKPVSIEQLMCGVEDSQRVQISGIVRAARREKNLLLVELVSGGYRFHVYSQDPPPDDGQSLVGARVRVSGTAAASFNATLRQLITTKIFAPLSEDFVIEQAATSNPFNEPVLPLDAIAQYRSDGAPGKRVHVKGTVTHQRVGEDLFLHDGRRGLHVKSREMVTFSPGEVVEAIGFPDFENFLPVLQDAVCRKTSDAAQTVVPRYATIQEVQAGLHHADSIVLQGKLIDRTTTRIRRQGNYSETIELILQNTNFIFTAEKQEITPNSSLATVPIGSVVEVTGIGLTETDEEGKLRALQVLIPAAASVRILEKPSWLTAQRLLIGLGVVLSVSLVGLAWTITVSKKNSTLRLLIRDKEKTQFELQEAHDLLEERVHERTAQLKFQITARKESELQFKAVLAERTRLAQELHDTLEQSLTGIALQLDTTSRLFQRNPEGATHHLDLARTLMTQSQVEVRRSIWDLRCRALEQFDLPSALKTSAHQLTDGSNLQLEVAARGRVRPLPERIEDNLLRIAQEALTNVIKHAGAARVELELDYGPRSITLAIRDDGRGFTPTDCLGPQEGHFGLLGISERAKRLDGEVSLMSSPGNGTCVQVNVPLPSGAEAGRLVETHDERVQNRGVAVGEALIE